MNLSRIDDFLIFSLYFLGLVFTFILIYIIIERKKKQNIQTRFRKFSENHQISGNDMRDANRITVPDSLGVTVSYALKDKVAYDSRVENISLSGFAVKSDFPLKKQAVGTEILNVKIKSPSLIYHIKRLKIVRSDPHPAKRLMAFSIVDINSGDFNLHKQLVLNLKNFLNES